MFGIEMMLESMGITKEKVQLMLANFQKFIASTETKVNSIDQRLERIERALNIQQEKVIENGEATADTGAANKAA